jgi:hypothetical protein
VTFDTCGSSPVASIFEALLSCFECAVGWRRHREMMRKGQQRTASDRRTFLTAFALAIWWVAVLAPRAEAYIDPSAGGMLVQLILAGTAGVAVLGKLFWGRVKRLFGFTTSERLPPRSDGDPPHDDV